MKWKKSWAQIQELIWGCTFMHAEPTVRRLPVWSPAQRMRLVLWGLFLVLPAFVCLSVRPAVCNNSNNLSPRSKLCMDSIVREIKF